MGLGGIYMVESFTAGKVRRGDIMWMISYELMIHMLVGWGSTSDGDLIKTSLWVPEVLFISSTGTRVRMRWSRLQLCHN